MAWVQVEQSLLTDKKTLKLKRLLSISSSYAIGIMTALWLWGIDNAPNGDITDLDGLDIADICDFPATDGEAFLKAFITSGVIVDYGDKKVIADWDERVGLLMAKREQQKENARERKRASRQRKKDVDDGNTEEKEECHTDITLCHTDVTALSQECHTDVTQCHTPLQYSNSTVNNSDDSDSYAPACTREGYVENVENYANEVSAEFKITYLTPDKRSEVEKLIEERADYYWKRKLIDYEISIISEELLSHHGGHVRDFIGLTADDEFLLTEAFKCSAINDCKKVSYIEGVYRNFRQRNINSIADYYNYADRNLRLVCSG